MSNPPEQPHRQAPGPYGPPPPQSTGPYGPPPQGPPSQQAGPPSQGRPSQGPPAGAQQQPQEWVPPERTDKGLVAALFDANFNYLVTPKLIKLWYVVALLLITLQCLVFLGFGIWMATWDSGYAWGMLMVLATPLVWLFELLMVRIFMEAVVVRFKGVEHLRVIKDKI